MAQIRERAGAVGAVPTGVVEILASKVIVDGECLLLAFLNDTVHPRHNFDDSVYEAVANHFHIEAFSVDDAYRNEKAFADALASLLREHAGRPCMVHWCIDAPAFPPGMSDSDYSPNAVVRFVSIRIGSPWSSTDREAFLQPVEDIAS
jgi:hypothetical protein